MTGTRHDSDETVLKAGPKRTVRLLRDDAGAWRVEKRFHGPGLGGLGLFGAPGDRRRATAELGSLRRARAAGLPVPEPFGIHRAAAGGWALDMKAIEGGQPLTSVLQRLFQSPFQGPAQLSADVQALAERIGELLRSLESAGFLHADPHPGNIVVDGAGSLWIVDLARSRVRARPESVEESLVRALSRTRELVPRTFRRRIASAWRGEAATPDWIRRIEQAATQLRIEEMQARVAVWRRTSSATEVRDSSLSTGGTGRAVWVRERGPGAPAGWTTERIRGTAEQTAQVWDTLVRAKLHALPTVEPRALALEPPHAVEFDVPASGAPATDEAAARTMRQLASRGLTLELLRPDAASFLAAPDGTALIGPFTRLVTLRSGGRRP